jgi:hypothetical protein
MYYSLLVAGAILLVGCSRSYSTPVSTRTSAGPEEAFDCIKSQLADLGYKQTSIDVDEHRISAVKIDMQSRRPDTQFRRILHRIEVEVAAEAGGQTEIQVRPHTFAEYTTQRGPTEVEENPADEVKTNAEQLLERCRS